MFDFSFGEMAIVAVVALVVLGPEKLPKVARTVGHLLGRARTYANQVKADIDREVQMDELRKLQQQAQDAARSFETAVSDAGRSVESEAAKIEQSFDPLRPEATSTPSAASVTPSEVAALETSIAEQAMSQSSTAPAPTPFAQHSPAIADAENVAREKLTNDVR